MRKFFVLKIISGLYKVLALLAAIICLVWAGLIMGDSILTTRTIEISINGDWSWIQQTFVVLVIGGLLSLTLFVIAEIIDAILTNYEVSQTMLKELQRSNELTDKLIKSQTRLVKNFRQTESTSDVDKQIAERKTNIKVENDDMWSAID